MLFDSDSTPLNSLMYLERQGSELSGARVQRLEPGATHHVQANH